MFKYKDDDKDIIEEKFILFVHESFMIVRTCSLKIVLVEDVHNVGIQFSNIILLVFVFE